MHFDALFLIYSTKSIGERMKKIKITAIFGTRPEAIKMCPLIAELKSREAFDTRVCLTGQHGDMVKSTLRHFDIAYDTDLDIMTRGQSLFDITERAMVRIKEELSEHTPHLVLVHGDTSSAFSAALSAFYMGIPIGHVEAGLRTGNIHSPFPEEFNRVAIDAMAELLFCPTQTNLQNLLREGKSSSACFVTGNTVVDAIKHTVKNSSEKSSHLRVLITLHRRENLGEPIRRVLRGVLRVVQKHPSVEFIFPVHPSPAVGEAVREILSSPPKNLILIKPLEVFSFHRLLSSCHVVLTDSGGLQEEACALGIPLILARDNTERPEAQGGMTVVGTNEERVFFRLCELIENDSIRKTMSASPCPFGDGKASKRIADIIFSKYK